MIASAVSGLQEASTPGEPGGLDYHSLALPTVFQRLQSLSKPVVLDLGPALGGNIHALEHLHPRIYIADLFSSERGTPRPEAVRPGASGDHFWHWLFRDRPTEALDVILSWDLLNYLTLAEIATLEGHLRPQLKPGSLLFTIVAQGKEIPDRPIPYAIRSGSILVPHGASKGRAPAPRYREPELRRALPGFVVDTSYLLRSGFQEYLLAYQPEDDSPAQELGGKEDPGLI